MELNDLFVDSFKEAAHMRLSESKERMIKCIDFLTPSQLVYRPNNVSNSIVNIIIHTLGNMTQYIISSLGNKPDERQRDQEFIPLQEVNITALKTTIESTFDEALQTIMKCTKDHLLKKRIVQGFHFDGIGIIMHVVEHASYHVGQITYLTKLLTEKETHYYEGFDLNLKNEI